MAGKGKIVRGVLGELIDASQMFKDKMEANAPLDSGEQALVNFARRKMSPDDPKNALSDKELFQTFEKLAPGDEVQEYFRKDMNKEISRRMDEMALKIADHNWNFEVGDRVITGDEVARAVNPVPWEITGKTIRKKGLLPESSPREGKFIYGEDIPYYNVQRSVEGSDNFERSSLPEWSFVQKFGIDRKGALSDIIGDEVQEYFRRDFGALPEGIKYESALSLQKPLITKDRNIHELAAEIASRGIGRSEGGVTGNTPKEQELMGVIIELMEATSDWGKMLKSKEFDVRSPEYKSIIKSQEELRGKIDAFDENDKIIDE